MTGLNSLAFRLFATTAAWTLIGLPLAGVIIYQLYTKQATDAFDRNLRTHVQAIIADSKDHGGGEPGEPRDIGERLFNIREPTGWYWQIKPLDASPEKPGRILRSPSLGTELLPLNADYAKLRDASLAPDRQLMEIHWSTIVGPDGERLRLAEGVDVFGEGDAARRYSIALTGHLGELDFELNAFLWRLVTALALVGAGLLSVTAVQVRVGLYPLRKVEKRLGDIRSGKATRLDGELPVEIATLQNELNALLKSNEDIIERARTQVGNLAHGLKTPLAVLMNEAREERSPLASKVLEQTGVMRDQVQHYLDRARMAARAGVIGRVTPVRDVAEGITRALTRIYRDKDLSFTVTCEDGAQFHGERQDLEEMLGNLLDNAAKWSKSEVVLTATVSSNRTGRAGETWLEITVEDDGPGLTPAQLAEPIQRGRRLDETKPGSGLGHSIVADLVHSYRGTFTLGKSGLGGLLATLKLPAA